MNKNSLFSKSEILCTPCRASGCSSTIFLATVDVYVKRSVLHEQYIGRGLSHLTGGGYNSVEKLLRPLNRTKGIPKSSVVRQLRCYNIHYRKLVRGAGLHVNNVINRTHFHLDDVEWLNGKCFCRSCDCQIRKGEAGEVVESSI